MNPKNEMWNRILTVDVLKEMALLSEDGVEEVGKFFQFIKTRLDPKMMVVMALHWQTYGEEKQIKLAVNFAGMYQGSRFIALMDVLSKKALKGELR